MNELDGCINIVVSQLQDFACCFLPLCHRYTRLDGSTNRVQRMINISQFQKPGSDIFIFLSSTRSGGLGLNLQSADTGVLVVASRVTQWSVGTSCLAVGARCMYTWGIPLVWVSLVLHWWPMYAINRL